MSNTDIVVGVDGSEPSRAALRWAAAEARRRGARLRILSAYTWPWQGARFGGTDDLVRIAREPFEDLVAEAVTQAQAMQPGIDVTGSVVMGEPGPQLIAAARSAANNGRRQPRQRRLRKPDARVGQPTGPTHAHDPVVVVRGRSDASAGPVVIGFDDSPSADRALEMAFQEAVHRNCVLFAVRALTVPGGPIGINARPLHQEYEALRQDTAQSLDAHIAGWREKYPAVAVETLVGLGSAAKILVEASHNAGLVVIGSRGHGTLVGTVLGSVGLQLIHHTDCPVMIVHDSRSA